MVVGVFGEARGAYSRPAPDLMVLERIQSLCTALPLSHPFPLHLHFSLLYPTRKIELLDYSVCYHFYCSFIYVL